MTEQRHDDIPRLVGQRIKRYRDLRGWSGRQLARVAGIQHTQLLKIERGESDTPVGTLGRIARALGLSLTDLVREEDPGQQAREQRFVKMLTLARKQHHLDMQRQALQAGQERVQQDHAALQAEAAELGVDLESSKPEYALLVKRQQYVPTVGKSYSLPFAYNFLAIAGAW